MDGFGPAIREIGISDLCGIFMNNEDHMRRCCELEAKSEKRK